MCIRDRDGRGRGSDGRGSNGNSDNSSASPKRRGRRSAEDRARELAESDSISLEEARKIIGEKKPRKVKTFSDSLSDGVVGSAILLGGIFEGGSQLIALAMSNKMFDRGYMKLDKDESVNLSEAVLKVLEAQSKYNRKRFDAFMQKVYPYWNLAKVATEISYPRYHMYMAELEYKKELLKRGVIPNADVQQAKASSVTEVTSDYVNTPEQASTNSVSSVSGFASWAE